jgi:hypothetical protein
MFDAFMNKVRLENGFLSFRALFILNILRLANNWATNLGSS